MISVKICVGTACYIMGAADLLGIKEFLSEEELSSIKIEGSTCLNLCKGYNPETPFAMVNDEVISNATQEILVEKIREILKTEKGA